MENWKVVVMYRNPKLTVQDDVLNFRLGYFYISDIVGALDFNGL